MKRKIYVALLVVFAAVFVFSAVNFVVLLSEYQKADALYETMQKEYVSTPTTDVENTDNSDADKPKDNGLISVDFASLQAVNPDVIGWIYAPEIGVNYPVVQADDNQTYLHKGLDGEYLRCGSIFADYRNEDPLTDRNFILYGHSMKNGSMFGVLLNYKKQAYYDKHPVWYYLTPEQNYRIELFAGRVVGTGHIVYYPRPHQEAFQTYLQDSIAQSTFQSEVTITDADSIMTLSTCSYEFEQARYVVMGKLIPIE